MYVHVYVNIYKYHITSQIKNMCPPHKKIMTREVQSLCEKICITKVAVKEMATKMAQNIQ